MAHRRQAGDGKGLLHGVAGADRVDPRGERAGRGHRAHRQVRLAAHGRHRHRRPRPRRALPARGRLELGDVERVHPLRRRLRVRSRRGNRHLHRQAARARAGGARRPDDAEIRGARPRRGAQLKLGILGGTFDPVHNAHLAIAKTARQALGLDKVLWIPTGKPGYRKPPVASVFDRLAMLALALKDEPAYEIDRRELEAGASPYTVDTLSALRRERPCDEFYLLLGADQYASFRAWRRPEDVARLARIAVFTRPGYELPAGEAIVVAMTPMPVSASDIRARAARGESLDG